MKKETREQLDLFRRQQEEADKALREGENGKEVEQAGSPTGGDSQWAFSGKKRKRLKEKEGLRGVKLRKPSLAQDAGVFLDTEKGKSAALVTVNASKQSADIEAKEKPTHNAEAGHSYPSNTGTASRPLPTAVNDSSTSHKALPSLGLASYSSSEDD